MLIGLVVLVVLGIYGAWKASRGEEVSPETKELGARVRRSLAGAANPIPGVNLFRGQSSSDFVAEPLRDEIGPDEGHVFSMGSVEAPGAARPEIDPLVESQASSCERPRRSKGKKSSSAPES